MVLLWVKKDDIIQPTKSPVKESVKARDKSTPIVLGDSPSGKAAIGAPQGKSTPIRKGSSINPGQVFPLPGMSTLLHNIMPLSARPPLPGSSLSILKMTITQSPTKPVTRLESGAGKVVTPPKAKGVAVMSWRGVILVGKGTSASTVVRNLTAAIMQGKHFPVQGTDEEDMLSEEEQSDSDASAKNFEPYFNEVDDPEFTKKAAVAKRKATQAKKARREDKAAGIRKRPAQKRDAKAMATPSKKAKK